MGRNDVEIRVSLKGQAAREYKKVMNGVKDENRKLIKIFKQTEDASKKSFKSMNNSAMGFKNIMAGIGTGVVVRSLINVQKSTDKVNNALIVATGSAENAATEFEFLRKESDRLSLDLQTTAESYGQLAAATKGTALEGQKTRDIFLGVSEASAALGLSADAAEGALRAFQQIVSKGNVQAEELRGQLGERIPGAFQMAARAMNLTTKQLNKQLELGKITAEDMLPKLAAEMRKTFGGQAAAAADTLNGKINRFKNTLFEAQKKLLEAGGSDLLKKSFDALTKSVKFLSENFDTVITIGKAFFAVWSVNKINSLVVGFTSMASKLGSMNPTLIALSAAAGAITIALDKMEEGVEENSKALQDYVKNLEDAAKLKDFARDLIIAQGDVKVFTQSVEQGAKKAGIKLRGAGNDVAFLTARLKSLTNENVLGQFTKDGELDAEALIRSIDARIAILNKAAEPKKTKTDKKPPGDKPEEKFNEGIEINQVQKFLDEKADVENQSQRKQFASAIEHQIALKELLGETRDSEIELVRLQFLKQAELQETSLQNTVRRKELERETIASINKKWDAADQKEKDRIAKIDKRRREQQINGIVSVATSGISVLRSLAPEMKALAATQALVDTYASANAAYNAMAGVPVIGPTILAPAAATAAIAAGLLNVGKIVSAADGGMFSGPLSGFPAVLHGNEAVIPLKNGAVPVMLEGGGQGQTIINNNYYGGNAAAPGSIMTEQESLLNLQESNEELAAAGV